MRLLVALLACNLFIVTSHAQVDFKPCSEPILHAVEDGLLAKKIGEGLKAPKSSPSFKGGLEKLKEYFAEHPLTNPLASNMVFRVHIGFLVNCEGKAGNFTIVSEGKGNLAILANEVLQIVAAMPQEWLAAEVKKQPVDCYQILSFTVVEGSLAKAYYRE